MRRNKITCIVALVASLGFADGRDACVTVDFSRPAGRIQALNGGNLGPQFSNSRRLADGGAAEFGQLGVPSVRLPADRRKVELLETEEGPRLDD